jgi:Uma2 family endonuclease
MAIRNLPETSPAKEITYVDYLLMPEIKQRYDIIDGVMHMTPAPDEEHQWVLAETYYAMSGQVRAKQLGVLLFAPLDIFITKQPKLRTRQPDLVFVSAARYGDLKPADMRQKLGTEIVPEMALEILSPDQSRSYLQKKLADYAAIGIPEVWLVSREASTVEVLTLEGGQYKRSGLFARDEAVVSSALPGIEFCLGDVLV